MNPPNFKIIFSSIRLFYVISHDFSWGFYGFRKVCGIFLLSFPSNELGNTQNEGPNNNYAKPSAWGSQPLPPLLVLRRGLDPPPVPRPLQGGGSTAPPRRSYIKEPDHSEGRVISYAT